ncbi:MAG: DUF222 domain-containing protein [Streptosporangiaceae bacterium]
MASADLPPSASASDALDMLVAAMRHLNAADHAAMPAAEQARSLKVLEQVHAMGTALHAAVLGAFTARQGYSEDGEYSPRSWLIHQADVTRAAAYAHTAWAARVKAHPKIARAMVMGILSESWARAICEITGKIPPPGRDDADGLLVWTKLHGATLDDLVALATEMYLRSLPDGPPDPAPADRGLRLATTLDGAGVLHGDLTVDCAAMVGAVLDALAKPAGADDTRSKAERYHDGLQEAMKRLLAADLLPARAGHPVKALVHMTLAELRAMDGGSALQGEWIAAAAARWAAHRAAASVTGSDGGAWLEGRAAQAVACDAILVPVVTGDIDPAALDDLVRLCAELHRLDHHDTTTPPGRQPADPQTPAGTDQPATAPGHDGPSAGPDHAAPGPDGPFSRSLLPGGPDREAIRQAIIGKAVDLVSGPGGLASYLRRRQLGARLAGPSLPLDIGHSSTIPAAIRTAVTLRDQHCQWAGKCDQPASACEVHHLVHQADGGKTSVRDCGLYCTHHHQIMIHQLGWTVTLNPDGTTTARSPDGTKVFRSHSPPASQPRVTPPGP